MKIQRILFLLVSFFLLCTSAIGQSKFELIVEIEGNNIKHLDIDLLLGKVYYEHEFTYKATKKDDLFVFTGEVKYPYLCEIMVDSTNYTREFLIHPGVNRIKIRKVNRD